MSNIYSIKVVGLVADIRNRELKIKRFNRYDVKWDKITLRKLKYAYLEQAQYCIEEYFSAISEGGKLNFALNILSKATYAVQQAKIVDFFIQEEESAG